jgi:hypothetical protein
MPVARIGTRVAILRRVHSSVRRRAPCCFSVLGLYSGAPPLFRKLPIAAGAVPVYTGRRHQHKKRHYKLLQYFPVNKPRPASARSRTEQRRPHLALEIAVRENCELSPGNRRPANRK